MSDFEENPCNNSKICRICAGESENGQMLFNSNSNIEKLAVQICSLIEIKLENIQTYPNWICLGCQFQFEVTGQFFELIRNGQKKMPQNNGTRPKRSRKPKRKRINFYTAEYNEVDSLPADHSSTTELRRKRVPKPSARLKDSMQGNELEELYYSIGITKRRQTKRIGHIEDQDGVTLGEMLSVSQNPYKKYTRYECDFCQEKFVRENAFFNHLSTHTSILYECNECQKTFQSKSMFNLHVNETNHIGLGIIETPTLKPPPVNQKEVDAIKSEELPASNDSRKFVCVKCPKSFNSKTAFKRHLVSHSNYRPFKCDICLATFKRKNVLEIHKDSHSQNRRFECNKCSQKFMHKSSLDIHLRMHDGLKPYVCSICKKSFNQLSNLKEHKRIHTGERPFVCLICGVSFKTSSQCRLHQKGHLPKDESKENDDITKTHKCKVCGKLFRRRINMFAHLRVHTGEKPFSCQFCPKKFADRSNFKKHEKTHLEQKPYACHLCPRRFADASNFRFHKMMHLKEQNRTPKQISYLKKNLNEIASESNAESNGLLAPNAFSILENVVLPNVSNSLIGIMDEDNDKNANPWNSDAIVTDIPNDENLIEQQQKQQQMLMNQLVCISYQDPLNPVSSKTTFYVFNQ